MIDFTVEEYPATGTNGGFDAYTNPYSPWVSVRYRNDTENPADENEPDAAFQTQIKAGVSLFTNELEQKFFTRSSDENHVKIGANHWPVLSQLSSPLIVEGRGRPFVADVNSAENTQNEGALLWADLVADPEANYQAGHFQVAAYTQRQKSVAVVIIDPPSHDEQVTPQGTSGLSETTMVIRSNDGFLESRKHPDDVYDARRPTMILAGPNGVANTAVNNERVALYDEFDQAAFVQQINEIYAPAWVNWNVSFHQANVEWDFPSLGRRAGIFNKDRLIDEHNILFQGFLFILGDNYRSDVNYVVLVFRMKNDDHHENDSNSYNFFTEQDRWLSVVTIRSERNDFNKQPIPMTETYWKRRFNTIAHEVGHGQWISKHPGGLHGGNHHPFGHPDPDLDPLNLMNYVDDVNGVLRKPQWDQANPFELNDPEVIIPEQ